MSDHHQVLIVGGGTAGISVAARLLRQGVADVAVVEPSDQHYYQPLWTLVGGGLAPADASVRSEASVMPTGATWIRAAAVGIDPENRSVTLGDGRTVGYDHLVMAPGIQLDWDATAGLSEAMATPAVTSNYRYDSAPQTWANIAAMRSGTAVFMMPANPIKCAGAPQKIAYLAADHWRRQGVLKDIRVVLSLPTPGMFGVPVFAQQLEKVAERYGIEVHKGSEVVEVDGQSRQAVIAENDTKTAVDYDLLHAVPRQSAPDWVKASPLADPENPLGYVQVDKHTLQHPRFPEVFALGDAGSTPNSKTGAAIRKQAPVLVQNLTDVMAGRAPSASYDGYASCPLTTARDRLLLAEFDYDLNVRPTFTFPDTTRELRDFGLFKRRGLPFLYWNLMLKGRA